MALHQRLATWGLCRFCDDNGGQASQRELYLSMQDARPIGVTDDGRVGQGEGYSDDPFVPIEDVLARQAQALIREGSRR